MSAPYVRANGALGLPGMALKFVHSSQALPKTHGQINNRRSMCFQICSLGWGEQGKLVVYRTIHGYNFQWLIA